jgi:hypothetical protein
MQFRGDGNGQLMPGLDSFLAMVGQQREAALCVANDTDSLSYMQSVLRVHDYTVCCDWRATFDALNSGKRVAVVVDAVSRELNDLFSQYNSRGGMVQIFDRGEFTYISRHLPIAMSRLIIVTTKAALADPENDVLCKAGLIFRETVV